MKSDLKQSEWSVNQLTNHVGGNPSQNSYYPIHEHTFVCLQMNSTSTLIWNVDLHLLLHFSYLLTFVICCVCITDLYPLLHSACPKGVYSLCSLVWRHVADKIMNNWLYFRGIRYLNWNANDLETRCSFSLIVIILHQILTEGYVYFTICRIMNLNKLRSS